MKKEFIYYAVLSFVIFSLVIVEFGKSDEKINASKIIDVASFEKLDVDLHCNIYVSIGDQQKVVFEGPEKFLNLIEAKLENGILKISSKQKSVFAGLVDSQKEPVNLYVRLTCRDQLITPKTGTLISNETSMYYEADSQAKLASSFKLQGLIRKMTGQLGSINLIRL